MKGILTRNEDGIWVVKWSDLHSFGYETHWMYTELSKDSNSIKFIKDNEVRYRELTVGLEVEFEIISTCGYDFLNNLALSNFAKLIFPEVEEFEKQEFIKEYVIKGNTLFSIDQINQIRDGGTLMLFNRGLKQKPFYIHKENWTLHNDYPTTDDNLVVDKAVQAYILDRLQDYKKSCQFNLVQVNNIIANIDFVN